MIIIFKTKNFNLCDFGEGQEENTMKEKVIYSYLFEILIALNSYILTRMEFQVFITLSAIVSSYCD